MCGIVGLVLKHRSVCREDIDAMNQTILHRGPDGDGVHLDQGVGIGMRRLSIIDLEGGWQPIANETDSIFVVQNGEIYNYRELRRELEAAGHRFKTNSDTEVIVHAFEQWGGTQFAKRLRGMFAIAIWDQGEQTLWLVRDRLGIKPLFVAHSAVGFGFASEIKALLASPVVQRRINPQAIGAYLAFGSADRESSFLHGVTQLAPGHVLRLETHGSETITRYWRYETPRTRLAVTEDDAAELVLDHLQESIRAHLVADVPVGAFLSGGIDSSAVVGAMVQHANVQLKTFSIGFEEARFDELRYARQVAEKWGCEHHEWIVRPNAVEIVEDIMDHFDEPFADASAIPTWFVSKLAAEHVKVVLSGDGGDELYAGYERYRCAYQRLWLDRVPTVLRHGMSGASHWLPNFMPGKFFLSYASGSPGRRYASDMSLFPRSLQRQLLRAEFYPERLSGQDPLDVTADCFRELATGDYVADCMAFDVERYLPMDILTKVDRMTMAHSLEARPPLLDHQFVEFSATLPTNLKFKSPTERKYILRKALRKLVPEEILNRRKSGFSVPLQQWFAGPLAPMFQDTVLHQGKCHEFLNVSAINRVFQENRVGRRDHGLRLWALLVLELWLRNLKSTASNISPPQPVLT